MIPAFPHRTLTRPSSPVRGTVEVRLIDGLQPTDAGLEADRPRVLVC